MPAHVGFFCFCLKIKLLVSPVGTAYMYLSVELSPGNEEEQLYLLQKLMLSPQQSSARGGVL